MKLHPGVYIEEIPSGSAPLEAVSTSIALIVGYATKGPPNAPTLLFNFDQYTQQFGGIRDYFGSTLQPVDHMGHTVQAFFNNGGTQAYIVRLEGSNALTASAKLVIPVPNATGAADFKNYVSIRATSSGAWANGLVLKADSANNPAGRYTVAIGWLDRQNNFVASETYAGVSLGSAAGTDDGPDFIAHRINGVSKLVEIDAATPIGTLSTTDKNALMKGSLTSGDLSGLLPTDFSGLLGAGFDVKVNGGAAQTVKFTTAPKNLAEAADKIQSAVRGSNSATSPEGQFTCTVENQRLVLRSNAGNATSGVAVTAGTPDASVTLKLTTAGAVTVSGLQAFLAAFATSSTVTFAGGQDGTSLPTQLDYQALLPALAKHRDISIILLPGLTWTPAQQGTIGLFVGHAEKMGNRMVIVDPPVGKEYPTSVAFNDDGFPTSTYTAAYYPWLEVANPWYEPELRPNRARTVMVAPSGFAAGMWAKTDAKRGVWKAPAGLQSGLLGAANTQYRIGDDEQDQLNPVGLNCFRRIISDIVIWGSRTLATKADPEWRYVPVRRTAMMLEESIYEGIQWAVFEPNDHRLWSSLRLNIGAFMDSLFRAGAFQGEKASQAYFVRCGLGDTMTQGDIDAGQVIVLVGFAPLKPAEFVVVQIQQIVGKS